MKNRILIVIVLLIFVGCNAKNKQRVGSLEKIPKNKIFKFIPKGYSILDTISGNLNLDKYKDLILILKKNDEEKTSNVLDNSEKRPLLILIGQNNGTYEVSATSNTAVYCFDCGGIMGDPYQEVIIQNGCFSVHHYGGSAWRWARIVTFKFDKNDNYWYLYSDEYLSFHASNPNKLEKNTKTEKDFGKVRFEDFDIFAE